MEKIKYEDAVKQLETILDQLESGKIDLDDMSSELKKAQQLIKICKDRLTKTDDEIKKILENK